MKKVLLPTLVTVALFGCANTQDEKVVVQETAPESAGMPLKYLANQVNLGIGAALETRHLQDPQFKETLIREFSQITPENEMKFMYVHPEKDRFDFSKGDQLVDFAMENNMEVKGHALVWHIQNPKWLEDGNWSKQELKDILENHIKTVVGHYKGKLAYWDVVNEAFDDNGGFRETLWYKTLGEEYIELAFRWAHEADPDAILFYNDYSTEGMSSKSNAVYRHIKALIEKGVPIHGVGTQLHLTAENPISDSAIARNIERLADLDLSVHFTEIDVRIRNSEDGLDNQAKRYGKLMKLAAFYPEVDLFTTWGISDKYSWIPGWFDGYGRALMFDENYQTKPAYKTVQGILTDAVTGNFSYEPVTDLSKVQRYVQAFNAKELTSTKFDASKAVFYPFAFNQLNGKNQALTPEQRNSIDGKWAVSYYKNKLIGQVIRKDNVTYIDNAQAHENDNIELFIRIGEQFWQFRSLVGQDFAPLGFPGKATGEWSADGSVFNFTVELSEYDDLVGETFGFNIALADNDGTNRTAQLYPLTGSNTGWQGEEFGEIFMNGQNAVVASIPVSTPPAFRAAKLSSAPTSAQDVLDQSYEYSLSYNQLNQSDMSVADHQDISGSWAVGYHENWLYGVVNRVDDTTVTSMAQTYQNDNVEVFVQQGEKAMTQFRSVVGKDFEKIGYTGQYNAQWNDEGTQLFFAIELSAALKNGESIAWNIALADNDDGTTRKHQLYPVPGSNISYLGEELTKLIAE
ncbi:hypothetical protein GCM10007916_28110 [Psychromonas marina]|uniref:Beta-xylanase n=1 Tax=Psychromonas marina TaxID=88364 RepID=A0ABQ6E411_9GAMM|nr:endo-1,4-beta-xylanase [Psychromonas marina]GLS91741.1 hypothetical protein GCM10007916_28110 [Psychromonas marina]